MELEAIKKRATALSQRLAFIEHEVEELLNDEEIKKSENYSVYAKKQNGIEKVTCKNLCVFLEKITPEFLYDEFISKGYLSITITKI